MLGGSKFHDDAPEGGVTLNLTALMDILSNLLFFLLASYSAQALEVEQKAELKLPSSTSEQKLNPSLTISVSKKEIQVAGVKVADIQDGTVVVGGVPVPAEANKIDPLLERLKSAKNARAAAGQADLAESEVIMLLADKATDSTLITKVLMTAGQAGFPNVRFGVITK